MNQRRTVHKATIAMALVGALQLIATIPAHGTTLSSTQIIRHPDLDWAGSQVAKHESTSHNVLFALSTDQTLGLDVSSHQGTVDWQSVAANGAKFAYIKATEGTDYTNPDFAQQYNGAYGVGIIRGAYHFATPDTASGAAQADYFVAHGGGWSADGKTLPGMLDLEWNPYGAACYGLSPAAMDGWINDFSNEYHAKTSRWPVIYTATSWWSQCTGNQEDFSANNPLALARYNTSPGPMPFNWPTQTIWQYADQGTFPGDQDYFNGDYSRVQALANG